MTRYQKLAVVTVVSVFLLVTIGVVVRATGSGVACPDWPLCYGNVLPPLDDPNAWIEWTHRTVAAVIGFLILGLAFFAVRDHRDRPSILWGSLGAVALVGFQAWLGRETVRLGNSGPSVTAHLATAMALVGLLVFLLVRSFFPARIGGRGTSQRFTLLATLSAAAVYVLLLFGSNVTAANAALVFPDWPLMGGTLVPPLTDVTTVHVLHRWAAIVVGLIVIGLLVVAWRTQRHHPALVRLAIAAAILYPIQAAIGGAQVLTRLAEWTQTLHVALGALIWGATAGLAFASYYTARAEAPATAGGSNGRTTDRTGDRPTDRTDLDDAGRPAERRLSDTIRAYVALTKPRIIELLLVTTVPAMVLAARDVPGLGLVDFSGLVIATLVGGTLAAGSANAINCYIDRDIDELMARTRRRPLPAHDVEPERAMIFGIALGVISLVLMAWLVNLVAAFLTLLAIAFYVVVYTLMLKRTTTQNIVIGGAAGALPPVIGWAAVTGSVGLPALILFALVFYWTPPHFWALSLRIRRDYEAARVPMLPVVRGIAETSRQILLYTVLLVAISLVFFAVGRMGWIYLAAAVVLGALFLRQAVALWRTGAAEEASTAGAIRLYRYSITYLSLLFLAVAVDAVVAAPLG
ncbi:MAG TPA: heme o synthase [Candidatus Limnocylindrales bacterium]|nr:heme o synthase [Candidatus Limnocylindrales bacterium]